MDDFGDVIMPFDKTVYDARLVLIRKKLYTEAIDALVCTCPNNIYYLTNYQTPGNSLTFLIITDETIHLITRGLETSNVKHRSFVSYSSYKEYEDPSESLVAHIKSLHVWNIGFEPHSMRLTVKVYESIKKRDELNWIETKYFVESIRTLKTIDEISYIKKSAKIVMSAIEYANANAKEGMTELELAGMITNKIMKLGGEYTSYPLLISSGKAGQMANHAASRNIIKKDNLLFMEIGCCYNRYHAAKMHTLFIGDTKPDWYICTETVLKKATEIGVNALIPGAKACDVDFAMRTYIEKWISDMEMVIEVSECTGYGIGIGLDTSWSENSQLCIYSKSQQIVKLNQTVHIAPCVQIKGRGSVGFSDTVLVTKEGGVSLLPTEKNRVYIHTKERDEQFFLDCFHALEWKRIEMALNYHDTTERTSMVKCIQDGIPNLYFKDESNRMGQRSFKVLGVSYALSYLLMEGRLRRNETVASMTDGNHGECLAYVANKFGMNCVIYVPHNTCEERVKKITSFGANVIKVNGSYDECIQTLQHEAHLNKWKIISDTAWKGYEEIPRLIAYGYCKLFDEAVSQIGHSPSHLFVQCGVGGLLASAIMYMKKKHPETRIICVEPSRSACVFENISSETDGTKLATGDLNSNMQGLNCGTPSKIAWPLIKHHVQDFIAIDDYYATLATCHLSEKYSIKTNPSGAAGFGSFLGICEKEKLETFGITKDSSLLFLITEGVTDTEQFYEITIQH